MKKIIVTAVLSAMAFNLYAKGDDVCYSVQLLSRLDKGENTLDITKYPSDCKDLKIKNVLTLRCGCFESMPPAKKRLKELQKTYKSAMLVNSYKYRFESKNNQNFIQKKRKKRVQKKQKNLFQLSKSEEELRLMLQVFLYKSDLENALHIAKIGVKAYPNSYYWNRKMAQIFQWTNRFTDSMYYLQRAYKARKNPEFETKLIDYGVANFQYEDVEPLVLERFKRKPTKKNIDLLILIYKKMGVPEKIIYFLEEAYKKDPTNRLLLSRALEISLEIGDMKSAGRVAAKIEKNANYSLEDALLLARYYYIQKDIDKAFAILVKAQQSTTKSQKTVAYYELKSDLGWYLQENAIAAEASKALIMMDKGRVSDYERVVDIYKKSDPQLVQKFILKGLQKYKLSYLFFSYANYLLNSKEYDSLFRLIQEIDKSNSFLEKNSLYWILKAKLYGYYKEKDLEEEALLKALSLSPDDDRIKISLLWHFINIKDNYKLRLLLMHLEEQDQLDSSLYFPMASAYFYLTNINRASFYTTKILDENSAVSKSIDFKFLEAYIYQIQNNEGAFKGLMQEIVARLEEMAQKDPHLLKDSHFLSTYLRAAINTVDNEEFAVKLKQAKAFLEAKDYDEIRYSYAIKLQAYDQSHQIATQSKYAPLWMRFNDVRLFVNHSKIENMLDKYLMTLSRGDAIVAAKKDGQIALAQSLNFYSFDHNGYNQNMYIQHRDLSKRRSDLLDIKTAYYSRDPLLQKYLKVKNKTYLHNGYYLHSKLAFYQNSSMNEDLLVNVPKSSLDLSLGIEKLFDKAYLGLALNYYNDLLSYYGFKLYGGYHISERIWLDLIIADSMHAQESTQLYIAGKKDMVKPKIRYQILPSTLIEMFYEHNQYYSEDDVYIGKGDYTRAMISKFIKSAYPDMRMGLFYDRGIYDEVDGKKGAIETIRLDSYPVLPRNFYNVGLTFAYGMANADIYTRVWRPYFELLTYYNSDLGDVTYGLNTGIGGKIFHQDHLIFGANYTESVNGIGGSVFELYLNYKFLYHLPR